MKSLCAACLFFAVLVGLMQPATAACQTYAVIMYQEPGCVWCEIARQQFFRHGVWWEERSAHENGFWSTPVFWVDGTWIMGYNPELLSRKLCVRLE